MLIHQFASCSSMRHVHSDQDLNCGKTACIKICFSVKKGEGGGCLQAEIWGENVFMIPFCTDLKQREVKMHKSVVIIVHITRIAPFSLHVP